MHAGCLQRKLVPRGVMPGAVGRGSIWRITPFASSCMASSGELTDSLGERAKLVVEYIEDGVESACGDATVLSPDGGAGGDMIAES